MVSVFALTVALSALSLFGVDASRDRETRYRVNHLAAAWSSLNLTVRPAPSPGPSPASTCPGCVSSRTDIESSLSNTEITSLRIEYIKQQILKKLRLKEPPTVKRSAAKLPEPLIHHEAIKKVSGGPGGKPDEDDIYDDFYGKTEQVILFPQEGSDVKCEEDDDDSPSACIPFVLPAELQADEVTSAELWIYQTSSGEDFVISEISHSRSTREANMRDGWMKFDIALAVKSWLEFRDLYHAIHIVCTSCDTSVSSKLPISLESDHKPFLLISTDSLSKSRRLKRNMRCAPGMTECCREELFISFAEIGWDDWILEPKGYNAYFCRGSCTNAASVVNSGSHYNTVIRKLLYEKQARGQKLELVPCCTASRLSSVQLLYVDRNSTVTKKTLPNMVVDSCGCM